MNDNIPVIDYMTPSSQDGAVAIRRARWCMASVASLFGLYYTIMFILGLHWGLDVLQPRNFNSAARLGAGLMSLLTFAGGLVIWKKRSGGAVIACWSAIGFFLLHAALWVEQIIEIPGIFGANFVPSSWIVSASHAMMSMQYLLTPLVVAVVTSRPFRTLTQLR